MNAPQHVQNLNLLAGNTFNTAMLLFVVYNLYGLCTLNMVTHLDYLKLAVFLLVEITFYIYLIKKLKTLAKQDSDILNSHYDTIPVDILKRTLTSVEYDELDKKAITCYLNNRHPGWSLT